MLHVEDLRPDTKRVYEHLRSIPEISRFLLIGGTAIALHHGHRESEDLDFVWCLNGRGKDYPELDRKVVNQITMRLKEAGFGVELDVDEADVDLAADNGIDLLYAQQNWMIDNVKLTFFAPSPRKAGLFTSKDPVEDGAIRMLTSELLFEVKSRLLVERATTRDLYDLWFYLDRQGRSIDEVIAFAKDENDVYTDNLIRQRLLPPRPLATDPGFAPRLPDGPQNFEELRSRLESFVSEYEVRQAEEVALQAFRDR